MKQSRLAFLNDLIEVIRADQDMENLIMSRMAGPECPYPEREFRHLQEDVTDRIAIGE